MNEDCDQTVEDALDLSLCWMHMHLLVVSFGGSYMSLVVRKPVFGVSNQIRHKLGCTTTEDALRLEISDLESRGIVLSV